MHFYRHVQYMYLCPLVSSLVDVEELDLTGWIRQAVLMLLLVAAEGEWHQGAAVVSWVGVRVDLEGLAGEAVVAVL